MSTSPLSFLRNISCFCLLVLTLIFVGCGSHSDSTPSSVSKNAAPAISSSKTKSADQSAPSKIQTQTDSQTDSVNKKEADDKTDAKANPDKKSNESASETKSTNPSKEPEKSTAPLEKPKEIKSTDSDKANPEVSKTADQSKAPSKNNVASKFSAAESQNLLEPFKDLQVGIDNFLVKTKFEFPALAPAFEKIKKTCSDNKLKLHLDFTPFFERKVSSFSLIEKAPFQWAFVITETKSPKKKYECMLLDVNGTTPTLQITEDGKWKLAECSLFLMTKLNWSLTDGSGKKQGNFSSQLLKPQNFTSSVYFPASDTPHFLNLIFDINLVRDGGTNLLAGCNFYMHPQGLKRVVLPVYPYYETEKKKIEKERGSNFSNSSVSSKPSANATPIGNVIYGLFVDRFFEGFHLNDKTDVGFDIYIENSQKEQILLYNGKP